MTLDRRRYPRERELFCQVRQLESDDVRDVASQLRRVPSGAIASRTSVATHGIERSQVLVKPRNDVLRDQPPAFWGIVGSPPNAYPNAEEPWEMLAYELEDDPVALFRVDVRDGCVPDSWFGDDEAFFDNDTCVCIDLVSPTLPMFYRLNGDPEVLHRRPRRSVSLAKQLWRDELYCDRAPGMRRPWTTQLLQAKLCELLSEGDHILVIRFGILRTL